MQINRSNGWKGLVIPISIFCLWLVLSLTGKINNQLFPTPQEVWQAFMHLLQEGLFWKHVGSSFSRVLIGFGLSIAIGIPVGLLIGCLPQSQIWFGPSLHFLRQIPPTALIPVFLLWFGIGEGSKYAVIFYAAVFPIVINAALGVQEIPKEYWEVCRALCLSPGKILRILVLPGSYSAIFSGLRLGMGMSWRAIVAAEMMAASSGLGYLVMSSRALVRVDQMFAGIIFIGVFGILIDVGFVALQNQLIPSWRLRVSVDRSEEFVGTTSTIKPSFQDI